MLCSDAPESLPTKQLKTHSRHHTRQLTKAARLRCTALLESGHAYHLWVPSKASIALQATEAQLQKVEEAAAAVSAEAVAQLLVHVRRGSADQLWACTLQSMSNHFAATQADGTRTLNPEPQTLNHFAAAQADGTRTLNPEPQTLNHFAAAQADGTRTLNPEPQTLNHFAAAQADCTRTLNPEPQAPEPLCCRSSRWYANPQA